MNVDPNYIAE